MKQLSMPAMSVVAVTGGVIITVLLGPGFPTFIASAIWGVVVGLVFMRES